MTVAKVIEHLSALPLDKQQATLQMGVMFNGTITSGSPSMTPQIDFTGDVLLIAAIEEDNEQTVK
jgi:hypothetical protein